MQKITPCLWFDNQAEKAVNFYLSIFNNSKIGIISRYSDAGYEVHGMPVNRSDIVYFREKYHHSIFVRIFDIILLQEAIRTILLSSGSTVDSAHIHDVAQIDYNYSNAPCVGAELSRSPHRKSSIRPTRTSPVPTSGASGCASFTCICRNSSSVKTTSRETSEEPATAGMGPLIHALPPSMNAPGFPIVLSSTPKNTLFAMKLLAGCFTPDITGAMSIACACVPATELWNTCTDS